MKTGDISEYLILFFGLNFLQPDEVDNYYYYYYYCFITDIMAFLPSNNSKLTTFTDYILEMYMQFYHSPPNIYIFLITLN